MNSAGKFNLAHSLTCADLLRRMNDDVFEMADFARSEGKPIPAELRVKISELCHATELKDPAPAVRALADAAADNPSSPSPATSAFDPLPLTMEVHGALSQLVAPATPETIKASKPFRGVKFVANNATVIGLLAISIVSLIVFLGVAMWIADNAIKEDEASVTTTVSATPGTATTAARPAPTADPATPPAVLAAAKKQQSEALNEKSAPINAPLTPLGIIMLFAAACLGSAFYGLSTAHRFVVERTFDPKYHQAYMIRFVLGMTSGTILGFFGRDFIDTTSALREQLGASVFALVGGYAAEAVSQILQRLAETLVTIVRGGNAEALKAKQDEMKADAKQTEIQLKAQATESLLKAKEQAMTVGAPQLVLDQLQKTIDSMKQ